MIEKINKVLLWVVACFILAFLIMVECFNGLSLDDVGFALYLQDHSIGEFIQHMYVTWQGRYMGFLINGIIIKSVLYFGASLPISLLFLVINTYLIARTLQLLCDVKWLCSIAFAIVLHGLYFLLMFDTSSYYWLCTKGYTLTISLSLFTLAKLVSRQIKWYDYILIVILAIFVGASWETYAPCILTFVGCYLLWKWKALRFNIRELFKEYPLYIIFFFVAAIAFFVMVFAPGNMVRLEVHDATHAPLDLMGYATSITMGFVSLLKSIFFALPYWCVFIVIMASIWANKLTQTISTSIMLKHIGWYTLLLIGMLLLTFILTTFALGKVSFGRNDNHVLLFLMIYLSLVVREVLQWKLLKQIPILLTLALMFLLAEYAYMIPANYPELRAYEQSEKDRFEYFAELQSVGETGVVQLDELDAPVLHTLREDGISAIMPTYTRHALLKPNEVSYDPEGYYNVTYKEYYKLNFDVITTRSYDL